MEVEDKRSQRETPKESSQRAWLIYKIFTQETFP